MQANFKEKYKIGVWYRKKWLETCNKLGNAVKNLPIRVMENRRGIVRLPAMHHEWRKHEALDKFNKLIASSG